MISAIVAVDTDWGIGFNGELLETIPEDLKRFKELTTGHTIIMGRKTWDSLPQKPLPKRSNIIISTANPTIINKLTLRLQMEDVINYLNYTNEDVFIIGGGQIYKELLPYCDKVYLTRIYKTHNNIDTYFPSLDEMEDWEVENCSELKEYNDIKYTFLTYRRIS